MDDDGPAFPRPTALYAGRTKNWDIQCSDGISKREYFAAAALTGILARFPPDPKEAAKAAYQYADAMIARGGE
jgi:hypothetical protein